MPQRQLETALSAEDVVEQLGGLITTHTLRKWARQGKVPGAFKIGHKVFFARNTAMWLLQDMSASTPAGYAIREPRPGTDNGWSQPPT